MSLMVNVTLTVLPIRVLSRVVALLRGRGVILGDWFHVTFVRNDLEGLERSAMCRIELHRVRIDDAGLLFHVEGIFLSQDASLIDFVLEFLLIV